MWASMCPFAQSTMGLRPVLQWEKQTCLWVLLAAVRASESALLGLLLRGVGVGWKGRTREETPRRKEITRSTHLLLTTTIKVSEGGSETIVTGSSHAGRQTLKPGAASHPYPPANPVGPSQQLFPLRMGGLQVQVSHGRFFPARLTWGQVPGPLAGGVFCSPPTVTLPRRQPSLHCHWLLASGSLRELAFPSAQAQ